MLFHTVENSVLGLFSEVFGCPENPLIPLGILAMPVDMAVRTEDTFLRRRDLRGRRARPRGLPAGRLP